MYSPPSALGKPPTPALTRWGGRRSHERAAVCARTVHRHRAGPRVGLFPPCLSPSRPRPRPYLRPGTCSPRSFPATWCWRTPWPRRRWKLCFDRSSPPPQAPADHRHTPVYRWEASHRSHSLQTLSDRLRRRRCLAGGWGEAPWPRGRWKLCFYRSSPPPQAHASPMWPCGKRLSKSAAATVGQGDDDDATL